MSRSSRLRGGESGFSLLEVLTVLAVFALIAGQIGLHIGAGVGAKDAAGAAAEVSAILQTARRDARRDGRTRTALFASDGVTVSAVGQREGQDDEVYRLPAGQVFDGRHRAMFFADGGASGGVVEIRGAARAYQLRISRFDGGVTIEKSRHALR